MLVAARAVRLAAVLATTGEAGTVVGQTLLGAEASSPVLRWERVVDCSGTP
jgi:hypothetical protein